MINTLYAQQSQQQSLLILFAHAARDLLPFNPIAHASVSPWGFKVFFSKPLEGERLLLTVIEEEMRRKQRMEPVETLSMMTQLVPAFLKSRKCALVGELPEEGAIELALFGTIAVVLKHECEPEFAKIGPYALFARENMVEGFAAVDKPAMKELKGLWKDSFEKSGFSYLEKWLVDSSLTNGALVSSIPLRDATENLLKIAIKAATLHKYQGCFDVALDDFNFKAAAQKSLKILLTTDLDVEADPLFWPSEHSKAALFLSFFFESKLKEEMKFVLDFLTEVQKILGISGTFSVGRGGKMLKPAFDVVSQLVDGATAEAFGRDIFSRGEVSLEFHVSDYRKRNHLFAQVRIGRSPTSHELYLAFIPFNGFEKIIALLLDRERGKITYNA